MKKTKKVVMAALVGSMFLCSMPAAKALSGNAEVGVAYFLMATGVSMAAGLKVQGYENACTIGRVFGAFFAIAGGALYRVGVVKNEEEKDRLKDLQRREIEKAEKTMVV